MSGVRKHCFRDVWHCLLFPDDVVFQPVSLFTVDDLNVRAVPLPPSAPRKFSADALDGVVRDFPNDGHATDTT